jgi:hypothetical protein
MGASGAEIVNCTGSNCTLREDLVFRDGFEEEWDDCMTGSDPMIV